MSTLICSNGAFYHREKRSHETEFRICKRWSFSRFGLSLYLFTLFRHMPSS